MSRVEKRTSNVNHSRLMSFAERLSLTLDNDADDRVYVKYHDRGDRDMNFTSRSSLGDDNQRRSCSVIASSSDDCVESSPGTKTHERIGLKSACEVIDNEEIDLSEYYIRNFLWVIMGGAIGFIWFKIDKKIEKK